MGSSESYFENVYDLCKQIPRGKVCTYGTIAEYLGLGSARMVGWALNKISLFDDSIPAHRVVNRKGELSGRNAFATPDIMQKKLEAEGHLVENDTVLNFKDVRWFPNIED